VQLWARKEDGVELNVLSYKSFDEKIQLRVDSIYSVYKSHTPQPIAVKMQLQAREEDGL